MRIFRFRDAMVHAKTATIDGQWSTIGTANIDRLSMTGNYEINVEVIDDDMAAAMEKVFEVDLSNCVELTQGEWESRDIYRRFTEAVLAPAAPAALRCSGRPAGASAATSAGPRRGRCSPVEPDQRLHPVPVRTPRLEQLGQPVVVDRACRSAPSRRPWRRGSRRS